jgi:hypothetical protein
MHFNLVSIYNAIAIGIGIRLKYVSTDDCSPKLQLINLMFNQRNLRDRKELEL